LGADATFCEERLPSFLRAIEAAPTPQGPVVLCVARKSGAGAPRFVTIGPPGMALPAIEADRGVPWNLRYEAGEVRLDYARSIDSLRTLLVHDLERCQQAGWLEFGTNNDEGRIPWSQIYYLNGYLDLLYLSRRDEAMFHLLEPLLADIRRRLDMEMALLDWHWRNGRYKTKAFTVDRSPALFAVQTARLLLLMNRYLREVPRPIELPGYADLRRSVYRLEDHIEMLSASGEPARWIPEGTAHLRWPRGSKFSFDGVAVPYNHQNEWAYSVLVTSKGNGAADAPVGAAMDIIRHFLANIAPTGHLPETGEWNYWWGTAYDGWSETDGVSVNRASYAGDKIKAWISFRSIDAMALLSGSERLDPPRRYRLIESVLTLVHTGKLYPFVSYELFERGYEPSISIAVADEYIRVTSPWELQNAAWAFLRRANGPGGD
jgi:hypothetical protein